MELFDPSPVTNGRGAAGSNPMAGQAASARTLRATRLPQKARPEPAIGMARLSAQEVAECVSTKPFARNHNDPALFSGVYG